MSFGLGFWAAAGGGPGQFDYELISTATGTGSSRTISFTSIPQIYKHLQIRAVTRSTIGSNDDAVVMNNIIGVTSNSYSRHLLRGTGTGVVAAASANDTFISLGDTTGATATSNSHGVFITDFLDYTSGSKNKTTRSFNGQLNASTFYSSIWSGAFYNTSAVTSFDVVMISGNFTTTSRISLYGIRG